MWKRRDAQHGTCWQRVNDGVSIPAATTQESDTCPQWTAKVQRVGW
jgi:hypothetical protein